MATQSKAKKINKDQKSFLDLIVDAIQDIKGKSITVIDLRNLEAPTEFFIICSGDSSTQVKAIADNVKKRVKDELQIFPKNFEGQTDAQWVLVDFFDVVVHCFYPETREFYDLEALWGDGVMTTIEDLD